MGEGSLGREETRPEIQKHGERSMGELDLTRYGLTQQDASKQELFGSQLHELFHNGIHEIGDNSPR